MRFLKNFLHPPVICVLILTALLCQVPTPVGYAFQVPALPKDNLIVNPWFRSASDPSIAGLDGWTKVLQNGVGWGLSQKESNPSPDIVISGVCNFEPVYCGTSARWADDFGKYYPNLDVYLYQVISANSSHRKLKFFTHWVTHRVEVAEVTIYGGDTAAGPWTSVWVPFFVTQDEALSKLWHQTGFLEAETAQGYSYYKVELHARYPDPADGAVGVKITGVYFATEGPGAPSPSPTPTPGTTPVPHLDQNIFLPVIKNSLISIKPVSTH